MRTCLIQDYNNKNTRKNSSWKRKLMVIHGEGVINENGEMFSGFCATNGLVIGGTLFPHKRSRKLVWRSPGRIYENQIDHVTKAKHGGARYKTLGWDAVTTTSWSRGYQRKQHRPIKYNIIILLHKLITAFFVLCWALGILRHSLTYKASLALFFCFYSYVNLILILIYVEYL